MLNIRPSELKPYPKNSRKHSPEQIERICNSITELGFNNPVLIDNPENKMIIAGHARVQAALKLELQEIPCAPLEHLTKQQIQAYVIGDNRLAELSEWETTILREELIDLKDDGFDLAIIGYDDYVFETETDEAEALGDKEEIPEEVDAICKPGDLWQLGDHRVLCGDCTNPTDLGRLLNMDNKQVDLVFTDPPYGMGKENVGVQNDNLNNKDLLEFNKQWVPLTIGTLKNTGSWYCWGLDEQLMDIYAFILKPYIAKQEMTFRNLITWDKGSGQGQNSELHRMYARADEKCLFVMMGVQGFNNNQDNYYEGWEPIRKYLEDEAKRVGLTAKLVKEITGVSMYSHWFTKSQWTLIPEVHYEKLQNHFRDVNGFSTYGNIQTSFKAINQDYEKLKKEFYGTRAYFDNVHDNFNNVWHFDRVTDKDHDHATPKPVELCERGIKSSCPPGGVVLDVFGGSGSTLIACESTKRRAYLLEISPHYCDVIIQRWEKFTGQKAELIIETHAEKSDD